MKNESVLSARVDAAFHQAVVEEARAWSRETGKHKSVTDAIRCALQEWIKKRKDRKESKAIRHHGAVRFLARKIERCQARIEQLAGSGAAPEAEPITLHALSSKVDHLVDLLERSLAAQDELTRYVESTRLTVLYAIGRSYSTSLMLYRILRSFNAERVAALLPRPGEAITSLEQAIDRWAADEGLGVALAMLDDI